MTDPAPFCIKKEDALAITVINFWVAAGRVRGVNFDKLNRALAHKDAIAAWQKANPDKVKMPD